HGSGSGSRRPRQSYWGQDTRRQDILQRAGGGDFWPPGRERLGEDHYVQYTRRAAGTVIRHDKDMRQADQGRKRGAAGHRLRHAAEFVLRDPHPTREPRVLRLAVRDPPGRGEGEGGEAARRSEIGRQDGYPLLEAVGRDEAAAEHRLLARARAEDSV